MSFSNLTDAELERLAILSEELGETNQIIGKILRHGYESYNPDLAKSPTNREMLEKELGDIKFIVGLMERRGDVDKNEIASHRIKKAKKIVPYLHHQGTHI